MRSLATQRFDRVDGGCAEGSETKDQQRHGKQCTPAHREDPPADGCAVCIVIQPLAAAPPGNRKSDDDREGDQLHEIARQQDNDLRDGRADDLADADLFGALVRDIDDKTQKAEAADEDGQSCRPHKQPRHILFRIIEFGDGVVDEMIVEIVVGVYRFVRLFDRCDRLRPGGAGDGFGLHPDIEAVYPALAVANEERIDRLVQRSWMKISHYAGNQDIAFVPFDLFPQSLPGIGEAQSFGVGFVDDHGIGRVAMRHRFPSQQVEPEHREIVRIAHLDLYRLLYLFFAIQVAETAGPGTVCRRRVGSQADHGDAGDGPELVQEEIVLARAVAEIGMEVKHGFFVEAKIFMQLVTYLAADDQGGDDEDLRDDELRNGECLTQPCRAGLAGVGIGLVLEDEHRIIRGQHERGIESREQAYDDDEGQQEKEDHRLPERVEMEILRDEIAEQADQQRCDRQREDGRRQGQQESLAQELEGQLTPVAAHGLSDADLPGALGRLGRRQVDKIDGGQQQQECGYGYETIERGFMRLAALVEYAVIGIEVKVGQRLQTGGGSAFVVGIAVFVFLDEVIHAFDDPGG